MTPANWKVAEQLEAEVDEAIEAEPPVELRRPPVQTVSTPGVVRVRWTREQRGRGGVGQA